MNVPDAPFNLIVSTVNIDDTITLNLSYPDDETREVVDKFIIEAVSKVANLAINIIQDAPNTPSGRSRIYQIRGTPDQLKSVIEHLGISKDQQKNFEANEKADRAKFFYGPDPKDIPEDEKWWKQQ